VVACPDDLGTMRSDQTKGRQALFNLLSNAAKFTDRGVIALTVRREDSPTPSPSPARGGEQIVRLPSPSQGAVGIQGPHGRLDGVGGGGYFSFAVADTGIGMTEEQLGRLFEAFSQAEAGTSEAAPQTDEWVVARRWTMR